jgi:hypothetical protein
MTYFNNPADLSGVLIHLAAFASASLLALIAYAEADDDAVRYYGADDCHTPLATLFADGSVEVAA